MAEDKKPEIMEIKPGRSYRLEHYRGSDMVSKYAIIDDTNGSKSAIFEKDQPLRLKGDGNNSVISIPGNIGLEDDDPPPIIQVEKRQKIKEEDKNGLAIEGKHKLVRVENSTEINSEKSISMSGGIGQEKIDYALSTNVLGLPNHSIAEMIKIREMSGLPTTIAEEANFNSLQVPAKTTAPPESPSKTPSK